MIDRRAGSADGAYRCRVPDDDDLATSSHDMPVTPDLAALMRRGWAEPAPAAPPSADVAPWAAKRRARLAEAFPGERLVLPAGPLVVRANDTDYRFRADSAHVWLSGNTSSDAVLVLDDVAAVLFMRPGCSRDGDAFWRDRRYGDVWAGRRPSLQESAAALGLECRHLDALGSALRGNRPTRVLRGSDPVVDRLVDERDDGQAERELAAVLAELRLVKDPWEIEQLQAAVDATVRGFEDCVREWDRAMEHGERWIEGTFWRRARVEGNDVGYSSVVAAGVHATTLHWTDDDGPVVPGELVLLDMGVEARTLYTADVSRTLPASGEFSAVQRELYRLELAAQEAAIAAARPGAAYRDIHRAAMAVLARGLDDLGVLPCSADEALDESSTVYRRWTLHGSGHMLGLDVHDCAAARAEHYLEGKLEPGHVLTVEPGLYFQAEDLLVPPELRGVGIRLEDDVLVTDEGPRNLSAALPREPDAVESWMAALRV